MDLPTTQDILDYIEDAGKSGSRVFSQREIARAFGIKGADRARLRALVKDMTQQGLLDSPGKKRLRLPGAVPPVMVLDITDIDPEGDLICRPARRYDAPLPQIILPHHLSAKISPPLGMGDRFVGRMTVQQPGLYHATPIKAIRHTAQPMLGIFEPRKSGGLMHPINRKTKGPVRIAAADCANAQKGDIIRVETLSGSNRRQDGRRDDRIRDNRTGDGRTRSRDTGSWKTGGRVIEVIRPQKNSTLPALLSIAEHDLPHEFPQPVRDEANALSAFDESASGMTLPHEDWRAIPFITIDPEDARDHDDAVFAEAHPDGWRLVVAIADVAFYVKPGTALDREARLRGNSTYLPGEVIPMLPERLSTDLCSLKAGKERPALLADMIFTADGVKIRHGFKRAIIRSVAALAYEEMQQVIDGHFTDRTGPLAEDILYPLWGAHEALKIGRKKRAPLAFTLPSRQIDFDDAGNVCAIAARGGVEAHRLIEEMMIQANICAAETLEAAERPLIYRVHDRPDPDKLHDIRDYLGALGYHFVKAQNVTPTIFNQILCSAQQRDEREMISQILLRAQSRAVYDTDNQGHFGLNLTRYAHFTSPIRRYADMTVHRALIEACGLGQREPHIQNPPEYPDQEELQNIAAGVTRTERRSVEAERDCANRYIARYLETRIGVEFTARISGVTRFGVFVTLDETGADGFVPVKSLGDDYYRYEESYFRLRGERHGKAYHMGQKVEVRLIEVAALEGGLRFEMISPPIAVSANAATPSKKQRAAGKAKTGRGGGGKRLDHLNTKKRPKGRSG